MKNVIIKLSMLLVLSFFSFSGLAQSPADFDGKYIFKHHNGFIDSVIISEGTLTHIECEAWKYGIEEQFVYKMISLKGEMITLEQITWLRNRVEQEPLENLGSMHDRTYVFLKDADGNLQIIYPGEAESTVTFQKVD